MSISILVLIIFVGIVGWITSTRRPVRLLRRATWGGLAVATFSFFLTSGFFASPTSIPSEVHAAGLGEIRGNVFRDFNANGVDDGANEIGIPNIVIKAYDDANTLVNQATTNVNGDYIVFTPTDERLRLEFSVPDQMPLHLNNLQPAAAGLFSSVVFAKSGDTGINVGFNVPADYCHENPDLATPCYVNGDPLVTGTSEKTAADADVFIKFPYNASGNGTNGSAVGPTHLAFGKEMGSTWGVAVAHNEAQLFTSAFLKRHVGMGPLGPGGIYAINMTNTPPTVEPWLDLSGNLDIDTGYVPTNAARGLVADPAQPSKDAIVFDKVGTTSLGGLEISTDDTTLYVVNLYLKTVHAIDIATKQLVNSYPVLSPEKLASPGPACNNGQHRPFGLKYFRGDIYVGLVCDGSTGPDNNAFLEALVYRLPLSEGSSNYEIVLRFPLDYTKGFSWNNDDCIGIRTWFPWTSTFPTSICSNSHNIAQYVHPTPVLSDIEFDVDGSMVLGFFDRTGHQLGWRQYDTSATVLDLMYFTNGDTLRAAYQNGSYILEDNATAGPYTTGGQNNTEGPGGGEFYYQDAYPDVPSNWGHHESGVGGLALLPGSGEVVVSSATPYGTIDDGGPFSGGINWFNNSTGHARSPGYIVYRSDLDGTIGSQGKANGLGDLELFCGIAPIEVGNRVWLDEDKDGIQDPNESSFGGVTVEIWNVSGGTPTKVGSTTTASDGTYYFGGLTDRNMISGSLTPNTNYEIRVPAGQTALTNYVLTNNNANGNNSNNNQTDLNDSDAIENSNGYGVIGFTTGNAGHNNHTLDIGYYYQEPDKPVQLVSLGDYVWFDVDNDGFQDASENGIGGVVLQLFDDNGNPILVNGQPYTDVTTPNGYYLFDNLQPGTYQVQVLPSNFQPGGPLFELISSTPTEPNPDDNDNTDDNGIDNPAPATNGISSGLITVTVGNEPINDGDNDPNSNLTVDFGFFEIEEVILVSLGDFVWFDIDNDGFQDTSEDGIGGVVLQLFDDNGNPILVNGQPYTDVTTSDGYYLFDNLLPGTYQVQVLPANFHPGKPLYELGSSTPTEPSPEDNDNTDDNGINNPTPGVIGISSGLVTVTPGDEPINDGDNDPNSNLTVDFGFYELMALGNEVWHDVNDNGVIDEAEGHFPGVVLNLLDENRNPILDPVTGLPMTTMTDVTGFYTFTQLYPGNYIVQVDPSNFDHNAVLESYISSTGSASPNDDVDKDDNGVDDAKPWIAGVFAEIVTLDWHQEPADFIDGDNDDMTNFTVDFGFHNSLHLPTAVTLITFDANWQGSTVHLTWETALEHDNFGFRIMRSPTTNIDDAVEVAFINGLGHGSHSGVSYAYPDKTVQPDQAYTYWLVSVALDATEIPSSPVSVTSLDTVNNGNKMIFLPLMIVN